MKQEGVGIPHALISYCPPSSPDEEFERTRRSRTGAELCPAKRRLNQSPICARWTEGIARIAPKGFKTRGASHSCGSRKLKCTPRIRRQTQTERRPCWAGDQESRVHGNYSNGVSASGVSTFRAIALLGAGRGCVSSCPRIPGQATTLPDLANRWWGRGGQALFGLGYLIHIEVRLLGNTGRSSGRSGQRPIHDIRCPRSRGV